MGEDVATGMHAVLANEPTLHYAIAGHTHEKRFDIVSKETTTTAVTAVQQQVYFNTGSWTTHLALPTSEEVTPELVAWLRKPDWKGVPLRDITQFLFVLVTSSDDEPATAQLCVWEGGTNGSYRVLTGA